MDDCLKRQTSTVTPAVGGADSRYELLRKKYTHGDFFSPLSKVAVVTTPDRLFDQLLGLSGHAARDCEPERLDRVAPENSVHRIAIASESKQLQLLSYSSFPGDCLKSRRQLEADASILFAQACDANCVVPVRTILTACGYPQTAGYGVVTKPVPNFTRLDPGRPEIAILIEARPAF
jgi:hypothetical protein